MQTHRNTVEQRKIKNVEAKKRQRRRAGVIFGFFAMLVLALAACDSGSGSDGGSAALNRGVFVDSPVAGLNFQTETQAGITDAEGTFQYKDGETVRFSIGDVVLGEAPAAALMTPLHMVDEPIDEVSVEHPVVTNMARLLQSLDADANPKNGIMITADMIREVSGRMIDFHQSVHEFENDVDVTMLFDTLNGLNMPHNGEPWHLRSTDQARQHMNEHMDDWMNGHMGGGDSDQDQAPGDGEMTDDDGMLDGMNGNDSGIDNGSGVHEPGEMMNSGDTSTGSGWDDMSGGKVDGHMMGS